MPVFDIRLLTKKDDFGAKDVLLDKSDGGGFMDAQKIDYE